MSTAIIFLNLIFLLSDIAKSQEDDDSYIPTTDYLCGTASTEELENVLNCYSEEIPAVYQFYVDMKKCGNWTTLEMQQAHCAFDFDYEIEMNQKVVSCIGPDTSMFTDENAKIMDECVERLPGYQVWYNKKHG